MAPRRSRRRGNGEDEQESAQADTAAPRRLTRRARANLETSTTMTTSGIPAEVSSEPQDTDSKGEADLLSQLSTELFDLILSFLSSADSPDLASLYNLALVSKALSPTVRQYMYRNLRITTRTNAHAMHRALHASDLSKAVKTIDADLGQMAKTSSQWIGSLTSVPSGAAVTHTEHAGWFLYHSSHSLCGIIGSCRQLLSLTLFIPIEASAWCQSICSSLQDLRHLNTLTKDLEPTNAERTGAGHAEGMDVGWKPRKMSSMWSVSQLLKPLTTLKSLTVLRICGLCSDSSNTSPIIPHANRLTEVVLIEMKRVLLARSLLCKH